VSYRPIGIIQGLMRPSRVLVRHVRKHLKLNGLLGNLKGVMKPMLLVVCEIKLSQQHRLGCTVEHAFFGQAASSP